MIRVGNTNLPRMVNTPNDVDKSPPLQDLDKMDIAGEVPSCSGFLSVFSVGSRDTLSEVCLVLGIWLSLASMKV